MVKSIENAYRHMEITLANQLSIAYPNENMREVLKNGWNKMEMLGHIIQVLVQVGIVYHCLANM